MGLHAVIDEIGSIIGDVPALGGEDFGRDRPPRVRA